MGHHERRRACLRATNEVERRRCGVLAWWRRGALPVGRGVERGLASSFGYAELLSATATARSHQSIPADPTQLLHVDEEELTRSLPLIAVRRLRRLEPGEAAEPDPGQDRRHSRERHLKPLRDLPPPSAAPDERCDRLHSLLRGAMRDPTWRRAAGRADPARPRRGSAGATSRSCARSRSQPLNSEPAAVWAGPDVRVQPHPVSSLVLAALTPPASKEPSSYSGVQLRNYSQRSHHPNGGSCQRGRDGTAHSFRGATVAAE